MLILLAAWSGNYTAGQRPVSNPPQRSIVDNIFPVYRSEVIEDNLTACYPPLKRYQYINLPNPVIQL